MSDFTAKLIYRFSPHVYEVFTENAVGGFTWRAVYPFRRMAVKKARTLEDVVVYHFKRGSFAPKDEIPVA